MHTRTETTVMQRQVAALVLLVHWVAARADTEYFIKYGGNRKTLMSVEGSKNWLPKINKNNVKRFLTFNNEEERIRVKIEFEVPFLTIPIGGKSMEGSHSYVSSPSVDVNVKALLVSGVLFLSFFFVIPRLISIFLPNIVHSYRGVEESSVDRVLRGLESSFNISTTACWQQGVCSLVQASRQYMERDQPPYWSKMIDGLSSVPWVVSLTEGTYLGEALVSAKDEGDGCRTFYSLCPVNSYKLSSFAKDLARRYMNNLIHQYNTKYREPSV